MGERPEMSGYAKAAAYAGLAFVTPASGWICYKIGQYMDKEWSTNYMGVAGLILGCAVGMYETFRQAVKIEGLDKKKDGGGGSGS
jgi:hypothetical protein